jgi:hypothetical protein
MSPKKDFLEEIEAMKPAILEACSNVMIAERNGLSVIDMGEPLNALNSCGLVSEAIIKTIDLTLLNPEWSAKYTGIQSPSGNHFAILLSKAGLPEEDSVIIDFTASQFDASLPFPLVMDCWDWQIWTESYLGRQGNWYHSYAW